MYTLVYEMIFYIINKNSLAVVQPVAATTHRYIMERKGRAEDGGIPFP